MKNEQPHVLISKYSIWTRLVLSHHSKNSLQQTYLNKEIKQQSHTWKASNIHIYICRFKKVWREEIDLKFRIHMHRNGICWFFSNIDSIFQI